MLQREGVGDKEQGGQERDLTLRKWQACRAVLPSETLRRRQFHFPRQKWIGSHHCHQGKALSFRVGGRPLKLLHLRFNANPVFKINSRSSWTWGSGEKNMLGKGTSPIITTHIAGKKKPNNFKEHKEFPRFETEGRLFSHSCVCLVVYVGRQEGRQWIISIM